MFVLSKQVYIHFLTCSCKFLHPNYFFKLTFSLLKYEKKIWNLQQEFKKSIVSKTLASFHCAWINYFSINRIFLIKSLPQQFYDFICWVSVNKIFSISKHPKVSHSIPKFYWQLSSNSNKSSNNNKSSIGNKSSNSNNSSKGNKSSNGNKRSKSQSFLQRQLMIANYRVKKFVRKSQ